MQNPFIMVVNRHRKDLLGSFLSDDILVQVAFDLRRLRQMVKGQRKTFIVTSLFGLIAADDAHAHADAVIADIASVSGDQPVDH